jgi:ADP-ribosylglycohydrolase
MLALAGCQAPDPTARSLQAADYYDRVYGAWQAIMVANHTGLVHEGKYLDAPAAGESVPLVLLDQWSTDDDTLVEWVDLTILETYGLDPSYDEVRDAWVMHLNHDIWVSTRRARDLMDQGMVPPATSDPAHNPDGAWSIDAQLETELFGLLSPGLPQAAARRAEYFALVTNRGPAVEASQFYATLYALAFFEDDIPTLVAEARQRLPELAIVGPIVDNVVTWHREQPGDWRATRARIGEAYDFDPEWWGSRVNFASTLMALLYGEGNLLRTLSIACLAGWDADNNATTAAGLLGVIHGFDALPAEMRTASAIYFNEDGTGDLPKTQTVAEIARRTQALAEQAIVQAGGRVADGVYTIPGEEAGE